MRGAGARRTIRARRVAQGVFALAVVAVGVDFSLWAAATLAGAGPPVARPPGVEGFLPISALMSLRVWLAGRGIHPVHPAGLAILVAVLAMSTVVARSFCSHLCPLGTLSEALGRLGERLLGRSVLLPRWLDVPLRGVAFAALGFFVAFTWVLPDLGAVQRFLDAPYNRVADVRMLLFFAHASRLTVGVLGALVVGSVLVRDLWCRYLCPYGALLGVLGTLAPLKVTRDPARCTGCRACTAACPARLPVHALERVASVACTSCQDCVAVCPVAGCLAVRPPRWTRLRAALRPAAAVGVAVAVWLGAAGAFRLTGHWRSSVPPGEVAHTLAGAAGGAAPREARHQDPRRTEPGSPLR